MNRNINVKSNYEIIKYNSKIEKIVNKKFGKFWKFLNSRAGKLTVFATGIPVIYLTQHFIRDEFFGNPIYHASGLLSFLTNRFFDYSSTTKSIDEQDDKFFEYDIPYAETNPLISEYPTKEELILGKKGRGVLMGVFGACLSTFFPPIGYGFLYFTPWVYMNNHKIAQKTKLWKKIGDTIKLKLNRNCPESEIECFLDKLEKNPKNLEKILKNK